MLSSSSLRVAWAPRCRGPHAEFRLNGRGVVTVRAQIIEAVRALDACLRTWNYRTRQADTGAYVCRQSVGGGGWSLHAYGIAIDINWETNPYGSRLKTDMPRAMINAICGIRTNNGKQVWNWGGNWSGNKDAMHYEIVCTPRDLATGINPATIPGRVVPSPIPEPKPIPVVKPSFPITTTPVLQKEDDMQDLVIQHNGQGNPGMNGAARLREAGMLFDLGQPDLDLLTGPFFNIPHRLVDDTGWKFWHKISGDGNALPKR